MEQSSESLESEEGGTARDESEGNLIENQEEKSEFIDNEANYSPKFVHNDEYEPFLRYAKRSSRNSISKNTSAENRDLEQRISELEKRADKLGVDKSEYISAQLPFYIPEYIEGREQDEGEDTPNGAVVIIYHKDKRTDKLKFLVEQKPLGYFLQTEEGRTSHFGGASKTTDKNSLETAIREISEEIQEPAASIIIDALRNNGYKYDTQYYNVNGQIAHVDILVAEIKPENNWRIVEHARTQHDAGKQRVLTENQAVRFMNYFAFTYGPVNQRFIGENTSARF